MLTRARTGWTAFYLIPPLRFLFKKNGGIYKFLTDFLMSGFKCAASLVFRLFGALKESRPEALG